MSALGARPDAKPPAATRPRRDGRPDFVLWYSALNPYMVERLNLLAATTDIRFEYWYSDWSDASRSWRVRPDTVQFTARRVPEVGVGPARAALPGRLFGPSAPRVLWTFHYNPRLWLGSAGSCGQRYQLTYYVEKTFDSWVRRSRGKELAKQVLFRHADAFLSPGADADDWLSRYGVDPGSVFRLEHAAHYGRFARSRQARREPAALRRRAELGLRGTVVLYVGRVVAAKGVWVLLDAVEALVRQGQDVSLLVVGDGADAARFRTESSQRVGGRVACVDFVQQDQLPGYYALGDVFAFPTLGDPYGIVVNEALAAGLPVVSSSAAGEVVPRLAGGRGLVVEPADGDALARALRAYTAAPDLRAAAARAADAYARQNDVDRWVAQVGEWLQALLSRSRGPAAARHPEEHRS